MKKTSIVFLLFTAALIAFPVSAQDITPSATPKPSLRERREEMKQSMQDQRATFKEEAQKRRDEFKLKTTQIRDQQKRLLLQRIEQNLNNLNQRLVAHLRAKLVRLSKIEAKIETRAAKVEVAGGDTTTAKALLAEVKTDIASLSPSLDEQADKTYTPQLSSTDSAQLKLQVGQTYQALEADMKALREALKAIKDKMKEVTQILRLADGEKVGESEPTIPEGTPSAQ